MPRKPTGRTTKKKVQESQDKPVTEVTHVGAKAEIDDDPWGDDGLTPKQRLFVAAIAGPAAGCATKAAQLAGYKSDNRLSLYVTASKVLALPHVQRAVSAALAKKIGSDPLWAESALADLALATLANFLSPDGSGGMAIDWEKAQAAGAMGQIKEYSEIAVGEAAVKRTIKLHDRLGAIRDILRLQGKLQDKTQLVGPDGKPPVIRVEVVGMDTEE